MLAYCNQVQVPSVVFFIRNYLHTEVLAKHCSFSNFGESQVMQHVNWQKWFQVFKHYHILTFVEIHRMFHYLVKFSWYLRSIIHCVAFLVWATTDLEEKSTEHTSPALPCPQIDQNNVALKELFQDVLQALPLIGPKMIIYSSVASPRGREMIPTPCS